MRNYHFESIRSLLINAFTDEELRRLCHDEADFRPVYDQLAKNTGKAEIVDRLLEHADRKLQLDLLLSLIETKNPARFEQYKPYFSDTVSTTTSGEVSPELPHRASILIVDDNPDWQQTILSLLKNYNNDHEIIIAASEAKAIEASHTKFDLAIIDLRLHGDDPEDESGLKLATTLRVIQPDIKTILLAREAVRSDQIVKALRYSGFIDFIEKAEINNRLIDSVKIALSEPSFIKDTSQLSLSIENQQPIWLRTSGSYVISVRTKSPIDIPADKYNLTPEKIYLASDPPGFIKEVGSNLYQKIFENDVNLLRQVSRMEEAAKREKKPLSMCFEIDRALMALPFEFVFTDSEYLILKHPVTRFVTDISPDRTALSPEFFSSTEKVSILLIGSNTPPLIDGVEKEINQLSQFFSNKPNINLKVLRTDEANLSHVEWQIRRWQPDIIHYAGHSLYKPDNPEQSALFFWSKPKKEGDCVKMTATQLRTLLQESTARFIYLSCCQSSTPAIKSDTANDDFLGIADAIIQAGVPSVLGFRWPLSDTAAILMAMKFYTSLFNKGSLPFALLEARRELANHNRDDFGWLSPILIHQV